MFCILLVFVLFMVMLISIHSYFKIFRSTFFMKKVLEETGAGTFPANLHDNKRNH